MKTQLLAACAIAGLSFGAAQSASAAPITFADATVPGFTITQGTLKYSNFQWLSGNAQPLQPADVSITTTAGGIRFDANWQSFGGPNVRPSDTAIQYTVDVLPGGAPITSVGLIFGDVTFGGDVSKGVSSVGETLHFGNNPAVNFSVVSIGFAPGQSSASTTYTLPGAVTTLNVFKDILASANFNDATSFATIGYVEQVYAPVPEPATLAFGLPAVAGLLLRKRRRA